MLWTLILAGLAWGADCTETVKAQEINALVQDALMGFAIMDEEGFYASTEEAQAKLPCLDEVFLPPNAAAYHRLLGIRAFYDGDDAGSTLAFRAARMVEPDFLLSDKIAPEGGKLHQAYEAAGAMPSPRFVRLRLPSDTQIFVNGSVIESQPSDVPAIVQVAQKGDVIWTSYLAPGTEIPAEILTEPAVADVPDEADEPEEEELFVSRADQERARREARSSSSSSSGRERSSRSSRDRGDRDDRDERDERDEREADDRGRELTAAPKPERNRDRSGGGGSGLMWGLAGGSAVVAGGLFATSVVSRGAWEEDTTDAAKGKKTLANAAWMGSVGFGVVALSLGGVALLGGE